MLWIKDVASGFEGRMMPPEAFAPALLCLDSRSCFSPHLCPSSFPLFGHMKLFLCKVEGLGIIYGKN